MRVLIAGGGTGGHVYPAVSIGKALQEKGAELLFVGTQRGLEREIVPREGFEIRFVPVESFPRRLSWKLLRAIATAGAAVRAAGAIVKEFRPHVCIGTGGYVAGPVVLAAALQRVPSVIQEQNAVPGLTNRILSRFADKVALGYPQAALGFRVKDKLVVTGNPVRPEIVALGRAEGARRLGLSAAQRNLLIFGASQGAHSINEAVLAGLDRLLRLDAHILLITGPREFPAFVERLRAQRGGVEPWPAGGEGVRTGNLRALPYVYDMAAALAAADLVVGRAGALSIAEITARGLPAVLVPYPFAAQNHQEKNAAVLAEAGAAVVVPDADLTGERLAEIVGSLLRDRARLEAMAAASRRLGRPDAVWDIVALIEGLAAAKARR